MGSYIGMLTAAQWPDRVDRLALIGTADAMRVHPELLAAADRGDVLAFEMVTAWSIGRSAHLGGHPEPGLWMTGGGLALLKEEPPEVLAADLLAVHEFDHAEEIAHKVSCPVLVLVGREDRMTPPASARWLLDAIPDVKLVELDAGHMMMTEAPVRVIEELAGFLSQ